MTLNSDPKELTNFAMNFLKFVKASGMLPDYTGFIVKITHPIVESELWRDQWYIDIVDC